jgi:hypothetical protein
MQVNSSALLALPKPLYLLKKKTKDYFQWENKAEAEKSSDHHKHYTSS